MIYIEQPAGVGYSICKNEDNCVFDDDNVGHYNLLSMIEWFKLFPEYKDHKFWISGESYGGIYVPFLANEIYEYNLSDKKEF